MNYASSLGRVANSYGPHQQQKTRNASLLGRLDVKKVLLIWKERSRERRALKNLSPVLLRDVGLSEEARTREVKKPFWKG